jgi:hypothetical protein
MEVIYSNNLITTKLQFLMESFSSNKNLQWSIVNAGIQRNQVRCVKS